MEEKTHLSLGNNGVRSKSENRPSTPKQQMSKSENSLLGWATFSELNKIWRILKELSINRNNDSRWTEYYITGRYRGFHKKTERTYKLSHITQLTFTNGVKEIYASGGFKEEALQKIFNRIDKLYGIKN